MSHIDPTPAQFDIFKSLNRDCPVEMLNLLHFEHWQVIQMTMNLLLQDLQELKHTGSMASTAFQYSLSSVNQLFGAIITKLHWSDKLRTSGIQHSSPTTQARTLS